MIWTWKYLKQSKFIFVNSVFSKKWNYIGAHSGTPPSSPAYSESPASGSSSFGSSGSAGSSAGSSSGSPPSSAAGAAGGAGAPPYQMSNYKVLKSTHTP